MQRIVLASASPRRAELLRLLGIDFDVMPCDAEERTAGADPGCAAEALALMKAEWAARRRGDSIVIGADTIVEIGGEFLGKPRDRLEARGMLLRLSGREHSVTTGVAVIDARTGRRELGHETTRVWFRRLQPEHVDAYIDTGEPMDKAGAYGIQGLGLLIVERIEGCYSNVVGLPLPRLARMLEGFGVDVVLDAMHKGNRRCSGSCGLEGAGRWRNGGDRGYSQPEHEGPPRERTAEGEDHRVRSGVPVERGAPGSNHSDR